MQRVQHIAVLLISGILMFSCAKQNSSGPSGGPQDETPPAVVKAEPLDKSVNFTEKGFEITFDEYFILDNVAQKLMISPPFEKKPVVSTKGKTLYVTFEEELRDSITYTFYFMDAVADLNERNAIENFQYVFSTGPTLDSLSVTGSIYDALSLDSGEEIFVLLYLNLNDTAPQTMLPEYITRAGADGKFRIDNIAEGEYAIYGMIDLNNNKIYDLPDESFAFIDSTITLSGSNNYIPSMPDSLTSAADSAMYLSIPGADYQLYHFPGKNTQQYLFSTERKEAYKIAYIFKQPLDSGQFSIKFIEPPDVRYNMEMSNNRDTVVVWILDSLAYQTQTLSVYTEYPVSDSIDAIVQKADTIDFRYTAPRVPRGRSASKEALIVTTSPSTVSGLKPGKNIVFSFSTPIELPDTSLLSLYVQADTSLLKVPYVIERDTASNKRLILKHAFIADSTYKVIYDRFTFTDIFGNTNDSTGFGFRVNNSESYGTLTMRLSAYTGNIILQLVNSSDLIVREDYLNMSGSLEVYYPLLSKGEYSLKAIFDLDGNGEWTSGNYSERLQPEPVSFFKDIIDIKVQWDLIQDWEINEFNFKNDLMRKEKKPSGR